MVHGLEKFKECFGHHTNQYVFIGGTACDILMDELGVPFELYVKGMSKGRGY